MHLSQRFLNTLLFYAEFCSPYNLKVTGIFKVREYIYLLMPGFEGTMLS